LPTYEAFTAILATTKEQVDWAYEVWDELVDWLTDAIIVDHVLLSFLLDWQ
jgi:hypothetical protein